MSLVSRVKVRTDSLKLAAEGLEQVTTSQSVTESVAAKRLSSSPGKYPIQTRKLVARVARVASIQGVYYLR